MDSCPFTVEIDEEEQHQLKGEELEGQEYVASPDSVLDVFTILKMLLFL